jgi:hypothetical protein
LSSQYPHQPGSECCRSEAAAAAAAAAAACSSFCLELLTLRGVVHEDPLLSERCTPHCSCVLSTQQCAHKAPSAQQQSLWPVLPRTCNLGSRTTVGAVGMMGAVGAGGRWADRMQPALREQWHTHHSPYAPNPHQPPPPPP